MRFIRFSLPKLRCHAALALVTDETLGICRLVRHVIGAQRGVGVCTAQAHFECTAPVGALGQS